MGRGPGRGVRGHRYRLFQREATRGRQNADADHREGSMMATFLRLWCAICGRGIAVERKPSIDLPDCLTCGPTTWRTADEPDQVRFPYMLNHNDKLFLKSIKVEPTE